MTIIGWIVIAFIFVSIASAAITLYWKTPQSHFLKRLFAITPILIGMFLLTVPKTLLVTKSTGVLSFNIGTVMPFICMFCALPLVIKVNKNINRNR